MSTEMQSSFSGSEEQDGTESPSWLELPEVLGNTENLSQLINHLDSRESPFDGDSQYEGFFDEVARALYRRSPRHALVQRERGVGDQAVFLEFAQQLTAGKYSHLMDQQVLRVDCRFVGAEESRTVLQSIFESVGQNPNVVLCLDGITRLLAPAAPMNNRSGFLSLLAQCRCRVIGIATPQEFEEHFAGRPDTDEFFSHIELHEPSLESAQRFVKHYAYGLSQQCNLTIREEAIQEAVRLSNSYLLGSRLPSKAVKILSDVCDDLSFRNSQGTDQRSEVTRADVIQRVSELSGVPTTTLAGMPDGIDYTEVLGSRVVGQDHVIEEVATELGLIRAGMVDAGKPASVMLFVGQTGTGKTELAKVVSKLYSTSKRLKTFTLGNYSEAHSVSGIIGVPAGYVGHEQGGRLVNELNADPYSVFLLDEADKAHPDVMQPFLNLFDEGWIADQRGIKAYAERSIFILTTNVGQRQIAEMQKKGKSWEEIHTKLMESLSNIRHAKANRPVFSAEFLARIKRVIIFKPLEEDAMAGITKQLCDDLVIKWKSQRQKELVIPEALVDAISTQAFEQNQKSKGKEGGRIVRKLIANRIEAQLQSAIANSTDAYRNSQRVIVSLKDQDADSVSISFE